MRISDAQREVRTIYRGGCVGQAMSAAVWTGAAALSTGYSHAWGMAALVIGGFFIFPVTTLVLHLLGGRSALSPGNPFRALAIQVAFVLPLSMPLLAPLAALKPVGFFPGAMILVGAHYLPFATLYGQRSFLVLGALLVSGGVLLALQGSGAATAAWVTAAVLLVFSIIEGFEAGAAAADLAPARHLDSP